MTEQDERYLRRAIELALEARAAGDMPYGSILVGPDGTILAEDRNRVISQKDVSAHPELKLAVWAGRELDRDTARQTTMYTSTQPCSMCAGAIARSGLGRVVFALSSEQHDSLKPPGSPKPDAQTASYEGPALYEEARVPIQGYHR